MIYLGDKFVIGIGGVARSGKDTLARILYHILTQKGYDVAIDSFAKPLRDESDEFLYRNFGISAFTTNNAEKESIRPFLVGLAECHRKQTKGKFFWAKLAERSQKLKPGTIILIPDLRFAEYGKDEIDFVNRNGWSFHLTLFRSNGKRVGPANKTESQNDVLLQKKCLENLAWDEVNNPEKYYIDFVQRTMSKKMMDAIRSKCQNPF